MSGFQQKSRKLLEPQKGQEINPEGQLSPEVHARRAGDRLLSDLKKSKEDAARVNEVRLYLDTFKPAISLHESTESLLVDISHDIAEFNKKDSANQNYVKAFSDEQLRAEADGIVAKLELLVGRLAEAGTSSPENEVS